MGGFNTQQNSPVFDFTAPAVADSMAWNWWLALLGAFFLATGAGIFWVMNGSYKLGLK